MGRSKRVVPGGWVYHVLNRANARLPLFEKDEDFAAFVTGAGGSGRTIQDSAARRAASIEAPPTATNLGPPRQLRRWAWKSRLVHRADPVKTVPVLILNW